MNKQEIFNKVWERSKDLRISEGTMKLGPGYYHEGCMYRPADGKPPCFAGVCFPDEAYDPDMENYSITEINLLYNLGFSVVEADLLQCCQDIHDETHPEFWQLALISLAEEFNLGVLV